MPVAYSDRVHAGERRLIAGDRQEVAPKRSLGRAAGHAHRVNVDEIVTAPPTNQRPSDTVNLDRLHPKAPRIRGGHLDNCTDVTDAFAGGMVDKFSSEGGKR